MIRTEVYNTAKPLYLMVVGAGKATHLTLGNDETLCGRFKNVSYPDGMRGDFCTGCHKSAMAMEAEKVAADEAEKAEAAKATENERAWDALKYTADGTDFNPDTCNRCLMSAENNADDTAREEEFEPYSERWYWFAVNTYSAAHTDHMGALDMATDNALIDSGIEDEAQCAVFAEAFRAAFDKWEYDGAKAIAAEAVATHVSSLIESATQDDNDNDKGGRTVATKKLKLKDVRGDVRIGSATGSGGTMHALKPELDADGRNVAYCPTKFKTPLRSFGPAMELKPEEELCAACSKVVPTGEVVVTEEPVTVPGLDLTVSQKKITPVEGAEGEKEDMPAKTNDTTQVPAEDVDAQITRVHEYVDAIKTAETQDAINALAGQAEDVIVSVPTKHRTTLRTAVSDAKKARLTELTPEGDAPATGAEVARRVSADVADDFNAIEGVPELIKDGVKLFSDGVTLGLKLGNVGEKVAHTMLAMRQKITNPDTGLPDLMADRKTTKNAAAEVYAQAKKAVADDDVDRHNALETLKRATQNKMSDVLVDWVRAFDGPDREESLAVARELFGDRLDGLKEDASITEAVYRIYADKGVELPRYGRTELARYDRRVKAIEGATKELEALRESADDVNPKDVEALEEKVKDLKADVPDDVLAEKLAPVKEKTDAEKTAEALSAIKAQVEKAGKRFAKVKAAADKRKAKAELYNIIRAAADAFELDLTALITADDED